MDLTIKNYRCFPDSNPARISLREGFTGLVGANNSGKSSLLRFFYEFRNLFQGLSAPTGNLIAALRAQNQAFSLMPPMQDFEELFTRTIGRDLEIKVAVEAEVEGSRRPIALVITVPRSTNSWRARLEIPDITLTPEKLAFHPTHQTVLTQGGAHVSNMAPLFEACKALSEAYYVAAFRNAINVGGNTNYYDIQVGQVFVQRWRDYKTGPAIKQRDAAYRLTSDIKRLFKFDDFDINASNDAQTLQVFVNGKSFNLHEMGAGLTQFILVLANAVVREPSFILIDEPELNLHPALQLDFLTTLGSYAREGVIFSTHSIGLARASAEQIYSLRRIAEGESRVGLFETTARLSEFLGELSFSGQKEIGFEKVLLVEGPTDVLTIQQLLRKYKRDHLVVLLPLGGSSLIKGSRGTELEEIKRISEQMFALIDSERPGKDIVLGAERAAFVKACEEAGITCHVLERRAIENYFSERAIKKVKGEKYRALQPFEKLEEVSPAWSKAENWRIALEMTREELEATDLGTFLASL